MRVDRSSALLRAAAGAALLAAASCSGFEVEGKGALETVPTGQATVHGSFWGYEWDGWKWRTPAAIDQCEQQSLAKVEVKTNVLYTLVSLFSLGLYVPTSVEWWCSAPPRNDDDVPVGDPFLDLFGGDGSDEILDDGADHDGGGAR